MTQSGKRNIVRAIVGFLSSFAIMVILVLHNAWGDDRYVLKADAIKKEIKVIDRELGLLDQEILFSETEREKAKFIAMKAIYERDKEALREDLKEKG